MHPELFEAHASLETTHWWFLARRQIFEELISELAPESAPGAARPVLVDVGCGTGGNTAHFSDDFDCVGIDTSADAIRLARERFPAVRFIEGIAPRDVGDALSRAEIILITDVLEHTPNDAEVLSTIVASARPGSHLLVTVPADMSLWSAHDEQFGHYRRYDATSFSMLWAGLPVEPRLVTHFNARLFWPIKWARMIGRLSRHAWGAGGSDLGPTPRLANRALTAVFAGEAGALRRGMRSHKSPVYPRGVSLIAILRRMPDVAPTGGEMVRPGSVGT